MEVGIPALKLCPEIFVWGKIVFRKQLTSFWVTKTVFFERKTGQFGLNNLALQFTLSMFKRSDALDWAEFFVFKIEKIDFVWVPGRNFLGFDVDGNAFSVDFYVLTKKIYIRVENFLGFG